MLDQLELVHMNGRIYDPLTARFMSADPLIQDPMNGQSYNRYSYVLNNPTNLTDPTGFSPLDEAMANRWAQRMGAAIADLSGDVKDKAIEMVNQMVNGDGRAAVNQDGNKQNGNGAVLMGGVGKDNSKMGGATNSAGAAVVGAVGDAANWLVEKTGLQDAGNAVGSAYNAMQAYFYGDATNGGTQVSIAGEQAQAAGDKALSAALMVSPVGPEALAGAVGAGSIKIVGQAAAKSTVVALKDFNQARNAALQWLEAKGFKAEQATVGKLGDSAGKPIGMKNADGSIGFRVEYDVRSGAHINVWAGKEKGPHFTFKGNESTVDQIVKQFNK